MACVAATQIDHVEVFVPDRYEVAAWYQQILGFEILSDFAMEAMLKSVHGMTAGLPSSTLVTCTSATSGHRVRATFDTAVSAVYRTMVTANGAR
jgi:catechol 2,3-dioxygenase-like lactoylglutathione lyase family enzyme